MTRFEFDSLHRGDPVYVHQLGTAVAQATPGTVDSVTVRARRPNEVGIRMGDGDHRVVWPTWLAMHDDAVATDCWRCANVRAGVA